jgi:hypothetical protein
MRTVIYWLKDNIPVRQISLSGFIILPAVLFAIPLEWLKNQNSICLFKNITGHECFGCGMTRAILSAIHLHFADAFHFNKLFLIVLPILIYIWLKNVVYLWQKDSREKG